MTRSGIRKCSIAIERLTSGCVHVETRALVSDLLVEVHRDAADCVSYPFKALEVDFDIVIDVDAEIGLDGVDQPLRTIGTVFALSKGCIDSLFFPRRLNRNPQISRERHQIDCLVLRIDPGKHDRVGTLPRLLRTLAIQKCRRIVIGLRNSRSAVGPNDQKVLHTARR